MSNQAERLLKVVVRALEGRSTLSYQRTLEAIRQLAEAVRTGDDWHDAYEEYLSVADVVAGAYWFTNDWHSGQASKEYEVLSALSEVYRPGMMESGPEEDSESHEVYARLEGMLERT